MSVFATKAEARAAADRVREIIERLPVAGMVDLGPAIGACAALEVAIAGTNTCAVPDAGGTHRYRVVHDLAPIEMGDSLA